MGILATLINKVFGRKTEAAPASQPAEAIVAEAAVVETAEPFDVAGYLDAHPRATFGPGTCMASFAEQSRSTFPHAAGRLPE